MNIATGTQFCDYVKNLSQSEREKIAVDLFCAGISPENCKIFKQISLTHQTLGVLEIEVVNDYVSVGNNEDSVRVPLSPLSAQKIADFFSCVLPTVKLVNVIHSEADFKLLPSPWGPPYDASMLSVDRLKAHNKRINEQLGEGKVGLISGHKKDVVLTNRLISRPKQVAIYGWIQSNMKAIQPLSLVHENTYADYSHGIRLIKRDAKLNGNNIDLVSVLEHNTLSAFVSDEGALKISRQPGT